MELDHQIIKANAQISLKKPYLISSSPVRYKYVYFFPPKTDWWSIDQRLAITLFRLGFVLNVVVEGIQFSQKTAVNKHYTVQRKSQFKDSI